MTRGYRRCNNERGLTTNTVESRDPGAFNIAWLPEETTLLQARVLL
jgi:hypothetical protein